MLDASSPQLLRGPRDVLGKVPFLLGPSDSIFTLYLGQQGRVLAYTNIGLDVPRTVAVDEMRDVGSRSTADLVLIVGYGPLTAAPLVTAVADAVDQHMQVLSTCMVSVGRYYCLRNGCACDAVTGVPFDPRTAAVAARSTVLGEVALPSRTDLLALVEPDPTAQAAVEQAIRRARVGPAPDLGDLDVLLERAKHDHRLTDDETVRIAMLLRHRGIRDAAWLATDNRMWQRDLWLDVTPPRPLPLRDRTRDAGGVVRVATRREPPGTGRRTPCHHCPPGRRDDAARRHRDHVEDPPHRPRPRLAASTRPTEPGDPGMNNAHHSGTAGTPAPDRQTPRTTTAPSPAASAAARPAYAATATTLGAATADRLPQLVVRCGPAGGLPVFDLHGLSQTAVKARALCGRGAR